MNRLQDAERRAPRILLGQRARLITSDGNMMDVVVADISAGGFRLEADETFYDGENIVIGETVILQVARRPDIRGKIVWASGREAGGIFLDQLLG